MKLNWTAIATGFVVTFLVAVISGLLVAGSELTTLAMSWTVIGIVGGLAAGYVAGGTMTSGVVHGGIATVVGSLVTLVIAVFTTLLFAGLVPAFGVSVGGLLLIAFYAVPGAIGGAAGSWAHTRREARRMAGVRA
ncbi:DUF5518 domain-containing protein [Natronosalvus rutilus]|uniref:DUF5518 domain-containing protein n=1 Tax=Natronosalvus rutilus TaxID=2953753 RepID=A0A9E7SSL8_9EURY|nr:DUF5518 domain-containing protein [Natronosalvus rutilus]UTF52689.1 DUF5518 domain-containing protein [Natronosalvus rutilus]